MKPAASGNRAPPAPTSAWSPDVTNPERSIEQGRITKQGDSMVRKLLYEAANSILTRSRGNFALKGWAMKIAKRRGLRKARVALARRLAVIMHAMLRDGTLFEA
jgi:transposase